MGDDEGLPKPLTAEQILEDLKNASKTDVVFTTLPENTPKGKGSDDEVEKVAANSAQLVEACDRLTNSHKPELPKIIEDVQQHISQLKDALLAMESNKRT